ncbi:MAG: VWA domain-containing protein [Planctomycetes bacterium]|nr:VWA domain-containing protein [Planctomycetota bacterium]
MLRALFGPVLFALVLFIPQSYILSGTKHGVSHKDAERLIGYFKKADSWALKSVILIALSEIHHPDALVPFNEVILEEKDKRLRAYTIECLDTFNPAELKSGLSKNLIDLLITKELNKKSKYLRAKIVSIIGKIAGEKFEKEYDCKSWWDKQKSKYEPATWNPETTNSNEAEDSASAAKKNTAAFIEQLFDLYENGLEIAIVLDTTGSMQPTINAVRDGLDDMISMLKSIVPKLRVGVVTYKDFEDIPKDGAALLVPLTSNFNALKEELDKLNAFGGGDIPERIEKGLEFAFKDTRMKWSCHAGKAVIIIGDAPPHKKEVSTCVKLAEDAYKNPENLKLAAVTTGKSKDKKKPAPFITSAIGVSPPGYPINPDTKDTFKEIAEAGGGSYSALGKSSNIIKHILVLSFGKQWETQVGKFVDLFIQFKEVQVIQ